MMVYNKRYSTNINQIEYDLISLDSPNYQYVAVRLLLYSLRKQVIGRLWDQITHLRPRKKDL